MARSSARDAGRKRHRYWRLLGEYARRWLPLQDQPPSDRERHIEELMIGCVIELEPGDRALVEGKYFARKSTDDLANETGMTARAVESRLFRLRATLRKSFLSRLRKDPL